MMGTVSDSGRLSSAPCGIGCRCNRPSSVKQSSGEKARVNALIERLVVEHSSERSRSYKFSSNTNYRTYFQACFQSMAAETGRSVVPPHAASYAYPQPSACRSRRSEQCHHAAIRPSIQTPQEKRSLQACAATAATKWKSNLSGSVASSSSTGHHFAEPICTSSHWHISWYCRSRSILPLATLIRTGKWRSASRAQSRWPLGRFIDQPPK